MESTSIYAALAAVQSELKAPKGQMNTLRRVQISFL